MPPPETPPAEEPPEERPPQEQPEPTAEERRRRSKRLAEIFGDELPGQTSDDLDPASDEAEGDHEAWLRRQVPPHHG
jgi:hypothetical protein